MSETHKNPPLSQLLAYQRKTDAAMRVEDEAAQKASKEAEKKARAKAKAEREAADKKEAEEAEAARKKAEEEAAKKAAEGGGDGGKDAAADIFKGMNKQKLQGLAAGLGMETKGLKVDELKAALLEKGFTGESSEDDSNNEE